MYTINRNYLGAYGLTCKTSGVRDLTRSRLQRDMLPGNLFAMRCEPHLADEAPGLGFRV